MTTPPGMDMEAVLTEAPAHTVEADMVAEIRATAVVRAMVAEIRAMAVVRATVVRADTEVKADMASRATAVPGTKCTSMALSGLKNET